MAISPEQNQAPTNNGVSSFILEHAYQIVPPLVTAFAFGPDSLTAVGIPVIAAPIISKGIEVVAGESPTIKQEIPAYAILAEAFDCSTEEVATAHQSWLDLVAQARAYVLNLQHKAKGESGREYWLGYRIRQDLPKLTGHYFVTELQDATDLAKKSRTMTSARVGSDKWISATEQEIEFFESRQKSLQEVVNVGQRRIAGNEDWSAAIIEDANQGFIINGRSINFMPNVSEAFIAYSVDGLNTDYEDFASATDEALQMFERLAAKVEKLPRRKNLNATLNYLREITQDITIPSELRWLQVRNFSERLIADLEELGTVVNGKRNYSGRGSLGEDYQGLDIDQALKLAEHVNKAQAILSAYTEPEEDEVEAEPSKEEDNLSYRRLRTAVLKGAGVVLATANAAVTVELAKRGIDPAITTSAITALVLGGTLAAKRIERERFNQAQAENLPAIPSGEQMLATFEQFSRDFSGVAMVENIVRTAGLQVEPEDGQELARVAGIIDKYVKVVELHLNPLGYIQQELIDTGTADIEGLEVKERTKTYARLRTSPADLMLERIRDLNRIFELLSQAPAHIRESHTHTLQQRIRQLESAINRERLNVAIREPNTRYKMLSLLPDTPINQIGKIDISAATNDYADRISGMLAEQGVIVESTMLSGFMAHLIVVAPIIKGLMQEYAQAKSDREKQRIWLQINSFTYRENDQGEAEDIFVVALTDEKISNHASKIRKERVVSTSESNEFRFLLDNVYDPKRQQIDPLFVDLQGLGNILSLRNSGQHFWRHSASLLERIGRRNEALAIKNFPADVPASDQVRDLLSNSKYPAPKNLHERIVNRMLDLCIIDT